MSVNLTSFMVSPNSRILCTTSHKAVTQFLEVENGFCTGILFHFSAVSDKFKITDVFTKPTLMPEQLCVQLNLTLRGKKWKI
jgi:hypothetical protein